MAASTAIIASVIGFIFLIAPHESATAVLILPHSAPLAHLPTD